MPRFFTTAPACFDGFSTKTVNPDAGRDCGKVVREVEIEDRDVEWQKGRNASGLHNLLTPDEWKHLVSRGICTETTPPADPPDPERVPAAAEPVGDGVKDLTPAPEPARPEAGHFVKDRETGKIELHFSKAAYLALPEERRREIKRYFLFSKYKKAWVSKATNNDFWARKIAEQCGLEDRGEVGEKLAFAEKVEREQERAAERADRFEDRAVRAGREWESRHRAADAIAEHIPFGQPILVGHHSEGRHRRDLERIRSHTEKAIEAGEKKAHYAERAAIARRAAQGSEYSDPRYLGNRIKEDEAEERLLERRMKGQYSPGDPERPISDEYRKRLEERLAEVRDRLGFHRHCLETCGKTVYTKESLKGKKEVKIRGRWQEIVKLNP